MTYRWMKRSGVNNRSIKVSDIDVLVTRKNSQAMVMVAGRVTIDTSPHLRSVLLRLLRRDAGDVVVIDVSKVSYLDTSGFATLVEALKAARECSVKLRLVGVNGQVRVLAEIVELTKICEFFGSEVAFT